MARTPSFLQKPSRILVPLLSLACVLAWALCAGPRAVGGAPPAKAPANADTSTMAALNRKMMAHDLRATVEVYKASGLRDPRWDAQAVAFIEAVERELRQQPGRPSLADLERQGRAVVLLGCEDPMVQFMYGRVWELLGDGAVAVRFTKPGAENMAKYGYPADRRAYAARHAMNDCKDAHDNDGLAKCFDLFAAAVEDLFKDKSFGNDRDLLTYFLSTLNEGLTGDQGQAILKRAGSVQGADPVALLLLEGEYHVAAAWEARGIGWAHEVKPQGWLGFDEHLEKARDCFGRAYQADKSIAEPPSEMIAVAMGNGGADEMRLWLDRALAARVDDEAALHRYFWGLLPRWHGDRAALLAFGQECFAAHRFDTMLPIQYVHALVHVRDDCDHGATEEWGTPAVYDKAHEAFERTVSPNGALPGDPYTRTVEAAFAVQAGRWEDARAAVEQLKGHLDPKATEYLRLTAAEVLGATYAYTGPAAKEASAGRDLAARGRRKEALESYRTAVAALEGKKDANKDATNVANKDAGTPDALRYLRGVVRRLEWETAFESGRPVPIKADPDFSGFHTGPGRWAADADGGMVATVGPEELLNLWCDADFGDHWELRADVTFLRNRYDWSCAGPTLCPPGTWQDLCVALNPGQQKFVAKRSVYTPTAEGKLTPQHTNHFVVRRDGARVTFTVNGQPVHQALLADTEAARDRIGFGGWPVGPGDIVQFRQVEVRRTDE